MFEIRFHGRGGQGVVFASTVLASAFFKEEKFVQAFPSFGTERRGAPVMAFTRISNQEIRERFGIYNPDCLVILDPSLAKQESTFSGLKKGSWVIINEARNCNDHSSLGIYRVAAIDASSIARKYKLGTSSMPIVNTTMLGAFARVTRELTIGSVMAAIKENSPVKSEENVHAALDAYNSVVF